MYYSSINDLRSTMMEKLYTIPVQDAFNEKSECPVCKMYESLENNAIDFVMGPSYMEDDVRLVTDKIGFCGKHIRMMYTNQNRLGLGLMIKTHMDRTIKDLEELTAKDVPAKQGLFKKKDNSGSPVNSYIEKLNSSCYVCNRIEDIFDRYIETIFHMYRTDSDFRKCFEEGKGFCTSHYGLLRSLAADKLSGDKLETFVKTLDKSYIENMKRVRDDVEWFTDKFDYRNADAPWKNSKDALPRAVIKIDSINLE